jgi:hypothetical protein
MPTTPTHVRLLQEVEKNLRAVLGGDARLSAARLDVLEGVAARLAGFSLVSYRQTDGYDRHYETADADRAAAELAPFIGAAPMPAALALATLAHPPLDGIEQRRATRTGGSPPSSRRACTGSWGPNRRSSTRQAARGSSWQRSASRISRRVDREIATSQNWPTRQISARNSCEPPSSLSHRSPLTLARAKT